MESTVESAHIMAGNTSTQYDKIIEAGRVIFLKKMKDYGTAWRILRPSSVTDQIFIKAQRIRSIELKGIQMVDEGIHEEFLGIVNYCIIALIQLEKGSNHEIEMSLDEALRKYNMSLDEVLRNYNNHVKAAKDLMENKNHDYSEAWREMRSSSMTDLILMKLLRIKQIENNEGKTLISEGVEANYYDILNYSVFALIQLNEN